VSRVFVRTTEPVRYQVDTTKANLVVVVLQNTRVPIKNNTRALDTRFFESAVRTIQAKVIEGRPLGSHRDLAERAGAVQEVQKDNVLALDFQRP